MSDSERNYHWIEVSDNEEYQRLLRPDGTKVTTITEPEDRNFYRDLAPVVAELNTLLAENARLREQAEALAFALASLFEPCKTDWSERKPVARCVYCDEPQGSHVTDCEWLLSQAALRAYREKPCPICGNAGVDAQGYECLCKEASHDAE